MYKRKIGTLKTGRLIEGGRLIQGRYIHITDDILIYGAGDTEDEARRDHDRKLEALLLRCRESGIALNKNKLKLRITEVPFMGHLFTKQGVKIDTDKAKAVFEMPRPKDVEGVQRLNGFVKVPTSPSRPHGAYMPPHTTRHRV